MGFGLSLISVVINIFILAGINERIKETDGELSKLNESLRTQAAEVSSAEIKNDLFMVLNHVSKLAKGDEKKAAGEDSIVLLQDFLTRYYAAVHEIPANEMLKTESDELAAILPAVEKAREAAKQARAGNTAEAEKLSKEAEEMHAKYQPITDLGKKLQDAVKFTETEGIDEMGTTEITLEIVPYLKTSIEQYLANYQKKEERIKELQNKKANLAWWASLTTYAAVSLQLFGLMFVVTKDLVEDLRDRREAAEKTTLKAEEEAKKAQAEAKESLEEAREAKEEADEYIQKAKGAREAAETARKQASEAEDMLAELKDEVRLAIDNVNKMEKRKEQ